MAQKIDIAYRSAMSSQAINAKFSQIIGENLVYKGFFVEAGTGTKISLKKNSDTLNILLINGASISEDADLVDIITIPANVTGNPRTDIIYAKYTHGIDSACTYLIATNTTVVPSSDCCLIATLSVPNGFVASTQVTINPEIKMYTINDLRTISLFRTGAVAPSSPPTNMVWVDTN